MRSRETYGSISHLTPWVCVDLEIVKDSDYLISAGVLYKEKGKDTVSFTFKGADQHKLFNLLERLHNSGAVLIGHNLRRHDLPWLIRNDPDFVEPKYCIDTLELFPIAFPSVKSFALDKTYKEKPFTNPVDDPIIKEKRKEKGNHPALDCRGAMLLLGSILDQINGFSSPALLDAYRIILGSDDSFGAGYSKLLGIGSDLNPFDAFEKALNSHFCKTAFEGLKRESLSEARSRCLVYMLSLTPAEPDQRPRPPRPWIRHTHPEVVELTRKLRGTDCGQCDYCKERFDLLVQIDKLFSFDGEAKWRNEGQELITESVMSGKSVLGVLPTSGGKSLTFQLPALINANNTGALTVVISPLRSLMDDQVNQLQEQHGRDDVCQISGKLNSIERQKNLRAVKAENADDENAVPAHIVYMAPEQLRSISVIRALATRGIGLLVIDEAHCMAKWGKDFRVEYRFIPELINRLCREYKIPRPPVLCLTATARKEVLEEIQDRFRRGMDTEVEIQDYGHARENLEFSCVPFAERPDEKFAYLLELVTPHYENDDPCLVFCSTRTQTEDISSKLRNEGLTEVAYYHGGCDREHRETVQNGFISGDLRLIIATNAFGMGVDKKNVRLVVHYNVPGSLENYVQEAGRAGRDDKPSRCILFYDPSDLDTQLDLRRRNQLRLDELRWIILTLRSRYKQAIKRGEQFPNIIISALDLMTSKINLKELIGHTDEDVTNGMQGVRTHYDEEEGSIYQKVTTALGILEESNHLERHENVFQPIPVPFRVKAWDKIEQIIDNAPVDDSLKAVLRSLAEYLFDKTTARDDAGAVDLEILASQLRIERSAVKDHIDNLRGIGVCNWGKEFEIQWDRYNAKKQLEASLNRFKFLIKAIEDDPEITYSSGNELQPINLNRIRSGSAKTETGGYYGNNQVVHDLKKFSEWGLFTIDQRRRGEMKVKWTGDLSIVKERLAKLSEVCYQVIKYLEQHQERKGYVTSKFNHNAFSKWKSSQPDLYSKEIPSEIAIEDALLFMHRRDVIDVVDGFAVLRRRMKLIPSPDRIGENYMPAYTQYQVYSKSTIAQVKTMGQYASLLAKSSDLAEVFLDDYFQIGWDSFIKKHFPEKERRTLHIPIRLEHFDKVFGSLTENQRKAVKAKTQQNHLILAGPGSGKTHILVLRIFYLIKVRNVPARSIAVLAYNRHAAIELRRRLKTLLPSDWYEIGVHTFHGLALRLVGRDRLHELQSDAKESNDRTDVFGQLLSELADALKGYSGDSEREQLRWLDKLNGIEYLLVDEFQDVSESEYQIVRLLSRCGAKNSEGAVHVMAVGDDDQNLYAFRGSSIKWIQQYEKEFNTGERITLPENFRSVRGIIETASRFISSNQKRLKDTSFVQKVPESFKQERDRQSAQDPDHGRVVRLKVKDLADARYAIASEINNVRGAFPDIQLGDICVAHRTNSEAQLTHKMFQKLGIASQVLGEHQFAPRYQIGIIETIRELEELDQDKSNISYKELKARITAKFTESKIHQSWMQSWGSFLDESLLDISPATQIPVKKMMWRIDEHLIGRAGSTVPLEKISCLTLHGTKGLEFHTVFLFPHQFSDDLEELRRLYFVGLSRAKVKAFLIDWPGCESVFWDEMESLGGDWFKRRNPASSAGTPSDEDRKMAATFKYFDTYRTDLGTGVNIFWPDNQDAIRILAKDQQLKWDLGKTRSGKLKLEFKSNGKCVGRLKNEAVQALKKKVAGDWDRIIGVEVAQIIQTDTEPDNREMNDGSETHYYVIPRVFYMKNYRTST